MQRVVRFSSVRFVITSWLDGGWNGSGGSTGKVFEYVLTGTYPNFLHAHARHCSLPMTWTGQGLSGPMMNTNGRLCSALWGLIPLNRWNRAKLL